MAASAHRFAQLLTEGVYRVRQREAKPLMVIQDELGYALGRAGGSAIEYWRKGHLPPTHHDIEHLAAELIRRGALDQAWLDQFLQSAGYPDQAQLYARCFPTAACESRAAGPGSLAQAERQLAPFVVGPPILHPRQFFGRDDELAAIFDLWRHHPLQNIAIIGGRRSGKTSLLHYLKTIAGASPADVRPRQRSDWLPQPERYRWVLVDFQDARMHSQERLLQHLLSGLMLPVPQPCDLPSFMDTISRELRTPAIILMDEIAVGVAAPELDLRFWWSLRSLGSIQTGGNLGFVLASDEVPAQVAYIHGKPSPFFNIFGHMFTLGPLHELAARALIASSPLPFAPDDIGWIMAHSGGWPYPLQLLCHLRLAALRAGDTTSAWRAEGLRRLAIVKEAY